MKRLLQGKLSFFYTLVLMILLFTGCVFSAGTLGGFSNREFPLSKRDVVEGIEHFYTDYPQYKMPSEWERFDGWSKRGYDFLDSRIFYFDSPPQEMYYVTFLGDANDKEKEDIRPVSMAVRSVCDTIGSWRNRGDFTPEEVRRIEKRFDDEIVSRLEKILNTRAIRK